MAKVRKTRYIYKDGVYYEVGGNEDEIDDLDSRIDDLDSRIHEVDPRGAVYTATIPTTGWTTASYGAYIDVAFQGAVFHPTDLVFVDLNTPSDGTMTAENEAWGAVLEAEPQEETGNIRFKAQEVPSVEIPVKAWVAQKAAVEVSYSAEFLTVLRAVYPIGSIYMSVNAVPPSTLFGFGTWEQIEDTFLLAAGNTYVAGATGGEAEHTLGIQEMPKHVHDVGVFKNGGSYDAYGSDNYGASVIKRSNGGKIAGDWQSAAFTTCGSMFSLDGVNIGTGDPSGLTSWAGNSQPHNNMPPYLAVYVWKRVA